MSIDNHVVFYDTETTGLPLFKEPSSHSDQPHIVQLAALLVDVDQRKIVSSIDLIVRPDGWQIPEEVTAIHGITTNHAREVGLPEFVVLEAFMLLWNGRTRIAHNQSFDARMIRIAQYKCNHSAVNLEYWKQGKAECTMSMAKPFTNLPKNKNPNLSEAYMHFFGEEIKGAHTAMADAKACMNVYFAIQDDLNGNKTTKV